MSTPTLMAQAPTTILVNAVPTAALANGLGQKGTMKSTLLNMQLTDASPRLSKKLSLAKNAEWLTLANAVTTAKIATGLGTQMTSTSTTESQLLADVRLGGEPIELFK